MSKFAVLVLCAVAITLNLLSISINAKMILQKGSTYSSCFRKVFQEHFVGESVLVVLPKFNMQLSDQLAQMLHGPYAVTIVDKYRKTTATASSFYKQQNIIFLTIGRLDLLQSINFLKSKRLWNPMARVSVILRNELVIAKRKSLLNMREIKNIFKVFMKERSLKVNVIAFDEHHVPTIFSWFPFDAENDCSNRIRVIQSVGKCLSDENARDNSDMIKTNHTDRPIIPLTFNGCPLHITAISMEPYTICSDKSTCDNGIEIRLFESVARSLKLSLKVKVEEKVDEITYSKILGRKSDLLIGGIHPLIKTRDRRLTQTVSYYQDELTWCVSEAPTISFWLKIFLIFDDETWGYFIAVTFFTGTVFYYFVQFHHHPENWYFCVAAGFFLTTSVPIPFNPTQRALRIVYLTFGIYGILATTTFNSFYMSTMTEPVKYKQISTREDLVVNAMKLYAENETISLYRSSASELSEYVLRNYQSCSDKNSCLETLLSSSSNNLAVAVSREHAMHHLSIMTNESNVFCFHRSENIYVYLVAALSHENFHLLDPINHQIQRIVEVGLITKWNADTKLTKKVTTVNHAVPFTILNVSGAILALAVGLTLAVIAFGWELYFQAKRKSSRKYHPSMWQVCESIWVTVERNAWSEIGRFLRSKLQKRKK